MATREDELNNEAILKIVHTAGSLVKVADRFFKKYGVTTAQYNTLVILNASEKIVNQSDLGEHLVVSRSDITGIIDRLEKVGYVQREDGVKDRRVKFIKLTPKGKALIKRVENSYFSNLKQVVKFLSERDKNNIIASTNKIQRGLKDLP